MQQVCTLTVLYLNIALNFTANFDYNPGPYNIVIPSEILSVTFNVSILADDVLEGDETFYLRINSSSLRDNVTTGDLNTTLIVIVDDDRKYFDAIYNFREVNESHSYHHYLQSVNIHC